MGSTRPPHGAKAPRTQTSSCQPRVGQPLETNTGHLLAEPKDTDYKKVIRDNNLQLHSRSAVMETYGAFSKDLWSLVTVLTDPASHPHASGDYDPWCRPEPRRDFFLSLAFAAQRGDSKMLREAGKRRRDRRADGRYATGTRA